MEQNWNNPSIHSLAPGLTEFLPGAFFIPTIVNTASRDIVILYYGELVLEGQLQFSREILELLGIFASRFHTKLKSLIICSFTLLKVPLLLLPGWEEY